MNRSSFALFVALLIHFVLLILFWLLGTMTPEIKKIHKEEDKKIKVSLREMPSPPLIKKQKESGIKKEEVKKPKIAPPMPKGSQLKKIVKEVKKPYIKYKPKKEIKKEIKKPTTPIKKQLETISIPKKIELQDTKSYIKLKPKKVDPMAWMHEDMSSSEIKTEEQKKNNGIGLANQTIKELYGDEFGDLSIGQQKYILDNQEIMRRITQQVLTRVAGVNLRRDLNVNRTNVIEFYLHPNGDMSDFKFLKSSGYIVLDDTTRETIQYSYSRYPRPTEKTLIRYNVYYNLLHH